MALCGLCLSLFVVSLVFRIVVVIFFVSIVTITFYFILVVKLFLSQPTSFTFLSDSPPDPTGSGEE